MNINLQIYPYEVSILKVAGDKEQLAQFYTLTVSQKLVQKTWTINRRYEDLQWLFMISKYCLPGYILPYFPDKATQTQGIKKLNAMQIENAQQMVGLRFQQLNQFINEVSKHPQLGEKQCLRIFLDENYEQYKRQRKRMDKELEELLSTDSKSFGIYNLINKGMEFLSSDSQAQSNQSNPLQKIKEDISRFQLQLLFLIKKFTEFIKAKKQEISWIGPETEIDSVEVLRAKIISSKLHNQALIQDIDAKIIFRLIQQLKKLVQLQEQVGQRQHLDFVVKYLKKFNEKEPRIEKINFLKNQFDRNFSVQWETYFGSCRAQIGSIDDSFRKIWAKYCQSNYKLWK